MVQIAKIQKICINAKFSLWRSQYLYSRSQCQRQKSWSYINDGLQLCDNKIIRVCVLNAYTDFVSVHNFFQIVFLSILLICNTHFVIPLNISRMKKCVTIANSHWMLDDVITLSSFDIIHDRMYNVNERIQTRSHFRFVAPIFTFVPYSPIVVHSCQLVCTEITVPNDKNCSLPLCYPLPIPCYDIWTF